MNPAPKTPTVSESFLNDDGFNTPRTIFFVLMSFNFGRLVGKENAEHDSRPDPMDNLSLDNPDALNKFLDGSVVGENTIRVLFGGCPL